MTLLTSALTAKKIAARNALNSINAYPNKKYRTGTGPYMAKRINVFLSSFCLSIVDMIRKTKGAEITPDTDHAAVKRRSVV